MNSVTIICLVGAHFLHVFSLYDLVENNINIFIFYAW